MKLREELPAGRLLISTVSLAALAAAHSFVPALARARETPASPAPAPTPSPSPSPSPADPPPRPAGASLLPPPRDDAAAELEAARKAKAPAAPAGAEQPEGATDEEPAEPQPGSTPPQIIVIGNRAIVSTLADIPPEQTFEGDDLVGFGASTVGEALEDLQRENGDAQPTFLVNGRPVANLNDINDLPVEAIERVETLPRGSAAQVGGRAGERAYNVVLKRSLRTLTATGSRDMATEGGWANNRGEAIYTILAGNDRFNLAVRGAESGLLFESERNVTSRAQSTPFAPSGNIIGASGSEIDPLLSQLAGQTVTVAGVPAGATRPTLADFARSANQPNPSTLENFRSLRGASRPIEVSLIGSKDLNSWLSVSINGRFNWNRNESVFGLPSARFTIPSTNAFTPFSRSVRLALNDPSRPLQSRFDTQSQSLNTTFNATLGQWRAALIVDGDRRKNENDFQFTGVLPGTLATVADTTNPFGGTLAAAIPIDSRLTSSVFETGQIAFEANGPLFGALAGPITARLRASAQTLEFRTEDADGTNRFRRDEVSGRFGVNIPLTGTNGKASFLKELGNTDLDLDYGRFDQGRFGTLTRWSLAFNWQPAKWLRVVGRSARDDIAIPPESLSEPLLVTSNVPYFDPVRGETAEVTTITGGAQGLRNEQRRSRAVAVTLSPLRKYRTQLDVEYSEDRFLNQIGALPFPSSAVVTAFPDRFVRDAAGNLVLVDSRSVNFDNQKTRQVRFGGRVTVPLEAKKPVTRDASGRRRRPAQLNLQAAASHTVVLSSKATIREGLPVVDLFEGGGLGVGGAVVRHLSSVNLGLFKGETGLRVEYARRGDSTLVFGPVNNPELLTFGSFSTFDLRAIVAAGQHFPRSRVLKGVRLTATVRNLFNERQSVTDRTGSTPQAFEPVRRDPIGRTFMLELRKSF